MELCDFNLETFANTLWKPAAWEDMLTNRSEIFDNDSRMKQIWFIMTQVASGVQFIHRQQEIHRDLKPENSMSQKKYPWTSLIVVVLYSRKDQMWKIADFGISMAGGTQAQTTLYAKGTSGYRAPELLTSAKKMVTNKADIWAIGCILYRVVFRRKIFQDDWDAREWSLSKQPIPDLPSEPPSGNLRGNYVFLRSVIQAMLAAEPLQRPSAPSIVATFTAASDASNYLYTSTNDLEVFLNGLLDVFNTKCI